MLDRHDARDDLGSYTGARLTAAMRGDLPWRLQRFLQDASTGSTLQRVGGHYAFRHEKIRTTLTAEAPKQHTQPVRRPSTA